MVHTRPLRSVRPLGAVFPPRAGRVEHQPQGGGFRRLPQVLRPLRPGPVRSAGLGASGPSGGDALFGHHGQAPRRLLSLGYPAHRLEGHQHAFQARHHPRVDRGFPRRGPEGRALLLAHRLEASGLHDRHLPSPAERAGRRRTQRWAGHGSLPRLYESPGPRAADRLWPHRRHVPRLRIREAVLSRTAGKGPGRLGQRGPHGPGEVAAA